MIKEEWKEIKDFEDFYKISNFGNIFSIKKQKNKQLLLNNNGYYRVLLNGNGTKKKYYVHRLVAKHFCTGNFENAVVNHKDCNKLNNFYSNLEWVSKSYNSKHAYINGRQYGAFKEIKCKLVFENGKIEYYETVKKCAKINKISKSKLYYILKNDGFIKELKCKILRCASNDYPEME